MVGLLCLMETATYHRARSVIDPPTLNSMITGNAEPEYWI